MNFSFTESQEMLKTMARDFMEKECPERFVRDMEGDSEGYSPILWRKIADMGWLGLAYPEKYGGSESSITDLTVLYEEMGRAMFPSPYLSTVVLCGMTIMNAGSEAQKSELIPRIAKGESILALAMTEPESLMDGKGWDAEGITVKAVAEKDNYVINGTKLFVYDAHIADYLLCVARTQETGKPEEGITLFLVDTKSPGMSYVPLKTTSGDKPSEVVFDQVKVPKKDIVGELNHGWEPLAKVLQVGAVLLCAEMLGAAQRALELSVEYAKTRIQFEQPIGVNQYVQEHCVNLLAAVEGSRWVTYQAAWHLNQGLPCDMEVAIAKAWTGDALERGLWCAHQVFAGVGYTIDAGVLPLYSRRAKSWQLYLGDSAYHMSRIALEMEKWPDPEMPKGKPLGLWNVPEEEKEPAWQPWKDRSELIQKRKSDEGKTA